MGVGHSKLGQRIIGALAGLPRDAGAVGVLSQLSRSFVSLAEHVGKHIEGTSGCRAVLLLWVWMALDGSRLDP